MTIENSKRLYKHYKEIGDMTNADRVADRIRLWYDKDGNRKDYGGFAKNPQVYQDPSNSYDITQEDKPMAEIIRDKKGKIKELKEIKK